MKKGFVLLSVVLLVAFARAGNEKNELKLEDKDKQNSTFFKMSRNSNRINVFEQLQSLIKTKSNKNVVNNGQEFSTYEDVVEILGEPNVKVKNTLVYTLNPSNGCKAVIELDANKTVIYIAIKDCN